MRTADGRPWQDRCPTPTWSPGPGIGSLGSGLDHAGRARGWSNPWSVWWARMDKDGVPQPQPPHNPFGLNRPGVPGNSHPVFGALGKLRGGRMQLFPVTDVAEPDPVTQQGVAMRGCPHALHSLQGPPTLVRQKHILTGSNDVAALWPRSCEGPVLPSAACCLAPLSPLYR